MTQNYRQDTRHSYTNQRSSQYHRQPNRYHHNTLGNNKQGQKYTSHYRERSYNDSQGYRNRQGRYYDDEKYKSGRDYRQAERGNHVGYEQEEYNKYGQQSNKDIYKGRQERTYSRDNATYRRYQGQYSKNYESRQEKRSRSRSRNKDQHYGQQVRDYGKGSGGYENKGYHNQSYSNTYSKNERPTYSNYGHSAKSAHESQSQRQEPYKRDQRQSSFPSRNDNQHFINRSQSIKNLPYQKQHSRHEVKAQHSKDQKKNQQPKNFISIEVKNRQRTPSPKDKKPRKSHSSRSKSRSVLRRSKEKSKRKHNKKHRQSSSSSHSSSYSSSSSSSSSNQSSSSSSSRSSSSSYSQSVESRRYKHKQYKDFYNKNSSQQRYPSQNYSSRQKYDEKYQSQRRPYEHSNPLYGGVNKGADLRIGREQRQQSLKQPNLSKPNIKEENTVDNSTKPIHQQKQHNDDKITNKKPYQVTPFSQIQKPIISQDVNNIIEKNEKPILPVQVKVLEQQETIIQSVQRQRTYEQRQSSFSRKYNPGGRFPSESLSYQQSYQNQRQYSGYNQYQSQQQQQQQITPPIQQSQVVDKSPHDSNAQVLLPSYPNRTYSGDNQKISFGGENDYQKRNFMNENVRRPYVNNYQNYPPRTMPYQSGFGNQTYQRFNQGFYANRPFQKNFYQNRNIEGFQQNLSTNNFNTPQNHFINQTPMLYQPNFPPQMRRASSQMVGQRKGSYFQQSQENKDNDVNKIQISKFQTEKEGLALIKEAFKRQSELKKLNQLIPCSKTLQLIEKARQNLSIPAIKTNFLILDLFRSMNDFKKQTMNSNLRSILQQDLDKKYNEQKSKVFENLRLLSVDEDEHHKQNQPKVQSKQAQQQQVPTQIESKQHETMKMEAEHNQKQNPQQSRRPPQFIWKKQQMSQTLRQLKSNIEMLRKASSSLSQLSRKIKVKEFAN